VADKTITVSVEEELYNLLEKRAKKNMCDVDELVCEILRHSMVSYKKGSAVEDKTDDALVRLFSRRQRASKSKKTKKPAPFYKSEIGK
jgi:hypothetical protein